MNTADCQTPDRPQNDDAPPVDQTGEAQKVEYRTPKTYILEPARRGLLNPSA